VHGHILLHRDLKPDNIAFESITGDDGKEVRVLKLIDFGLAKLVKRREGPAYVNARYNMTGETGSPRYMAPECHCSLPYSEKADVYSFAMCVWEVVELTLPFQDATTLQQFREEVVQGGLRPPIGTYWPKALSQLVSSCWAHDMDERPSFNEVILLA
ncbi:unnamed protein product, partial [Chrysoparadoxa australica]